MLNYIYCKMVYVHCTMYIGSGKQWGGGGGGGRGGGEVGNSATAQFVWSQLLVRQPYTKIRKVPAEFFLLFVVRAKKKFHGFTQSKLKR